MADSVYDDKRLQQLADVRFRPLSGPRSSFGELVESCQALLEYCDQLEKRITALEEEKTP